MDTTTFFFNASGCAVGGEIRSPERKTIDSAAAASLPITGGESNATADRFNVPGVLSYLSTATCVSGKRDDVDGSHKTVITTSVNGLNMGGGVVTADRVIGKLSSNCKDGDAENCINADGSAFVNLQVGGYPVTVELDLTMFGDLDTMDKFKKKYQEDPAFKKMAQKRFLWDDVDGNAPDWLKQRYNWVKPAGAIPESRGIVPCSIVKSITCANPNVQIFGNVIIVPNFGTIFLGEVLLKANTRRLTMMRVAMGQETTTTSALKATASASGDVTVCGVDNNGVPFP